MDKLLAILGPTSSGKTDIALRLADKFHAELVSCDSRQVYKSLDIGTGKLPSQDSKVDVFKSNGFWIINGIRIWLYDVADPKKQYTVSHYIKDATKAISEIKKLSKLPIIVGGSGLYFKGLMEGIPNLDIPVDSKLRRQLQKLSVKELQEKLQNISFESWNKLNESDKKNPRRLLRSIEIALMNPYIKESQKSKFKNQKYNVLKIGLMAPRDVLNKRIDVRVYSRINQGMIEEAEKLHKEGLTFERMKELGLEYGVLADYLIGKSSKEELIEKLKTKIHQYAKRQVTWFKKEKNITWFDITKENYINNVERLVIDWYNMS